MIAYVVRDRHKQYLDNDSNYMSDIRDACFFRTKKEAESCVEKTIPNYEKVKKVEIRVISNRKMRPYNYSKDCL